MAARPLPAAWPHSARSRERRCAPFLSPGSQVGVVCPPPERPQVWDLIVGGVCPRGDEGERPGLPWGPQAVRSCPPFPPSPPPPRRGRPVLSGPDVIPQGPKLGCLSRFLLRLGVLPVWPSPAQSREAILGGGELPVSKP